MSDKAPCDRCEELVDVDEANTDSPSMPDGLPNYFYCDDCDLIESTKERIWEVRAIPHEDGKIGASRVERLVELIERLENNDN